MNSVGLALQKARKDKGWTQQELAERADISVDWVRSLEIGRTENPRMNTLNKAAAALGVSADSLIRGVPEPLGDGMSNQYMTPEHMQALNAAFLTLQRLSLRRLKAAQEFLEVFARMDED